MKGATATPRPPLWLAAGAVASGWAAVYSIGRWIAYFVQHPIHEDVRLIYVAAEAVTRYGWSTIYDEGTLRTLSSSFPADDRTIDSVLTYLHPPLLAWIFAPLTVFPESVAYVLWTAISVAALVFAWHLAAPYQGLADVGHTFFTVAYLFGLHLGPATYAVLAVQGIACLYVAWSRREDLDIVFAAGLLGTLMVSIHLHQPDYSNLVLAAWLVLRGTPSLAHRLWFGVGIVTMQVLTLGQPVPQLLWDAGWLTILGVGGIKPRRESLSHDRSAEPAVEPVV